MKIEEARILAEEYINLIREQCLRIALVGSIRRNKPEVNDIDLVIIPKLTFFPSRVVPEGGKIIKSGNKLLSFIWKNTQFDIYFATEQTYETLVLIRTGSANHNVKLCSIAKSKGWKLKANGEGLLDEEDCVIATTQTDG